MKKLIIFLLPLILCACVAAQKKNFTPYASLIQTWEEADKSYNPNHHRSYIVVFNKDGKTLIYLAAEHRTKKTLAFVDYVFEKYKPQIVLLEVQRAVRIFPYSDFEGEYAAALAAKNKIPIVKADLSIDDNWKKISAATDKYSYLDFQAYWIIMGIINGFTASDGVSRRVNHGNAEYETENYKDYNADFGPRITAKQLNDWTKKEFGVEFDKMKFYDKRYDNITWPVTSLKYKTNQLSIDEDKLGRDPFMLENIAAALNKYKTVFAVFGSGHYAVQRQALENMLGKPMYVWEVQLDVKEEILVP